MKPLTLVKAGAAWIVILGFAVSPLTAAATLKDPAVVLGGATTEPQPRRSCSVVCGNPPNDTFPLRRTVSSDPLRSTAAMGTGIPTGQAAGAMTVSVCP